MDEPPARFLVRIGRAVEETIEDAIEDHERRWHAIPPARRGPLQAIPFPDLVLTDVQVAHARELLDESATIEEAAYMLDTPVSALERALAEYRPRWRRFLRDRETAG